MKKYEHETEIETSQLRLRGTAEVKFEPVEVEIDEPLFLDDSLESWGYGGVESAVEEAVELVSLESWGYGGVESAVEDKEVTEASVVVLGVVCETKHKSLVEKHEALVKKNKALDKRYKTLRDKMKKLKEDIA